MFIHVKDAYLKEKCTSHVFMGHDCLMRTYPHESNDMTVISLGQTHSFGDGSFRDQGKATP